MALCIRGSQSCWVCFQFNTKTTVMGRWGTIIVVCLTIFRTSHHLSECRQMIVLLCLPSDACITRPNWCVNMLSRRMNVYVCIRSDQSKCSENDAYGGKHCPSWFFFFFLSLINQLMYKQTVLSTRTMRCNEKAYGAKQVSDEWKQKGRFGSQAASPTNYLSTSA